MMFVPTSMPSLSKIYAILLSVLLLPLAAATAQPVWLDPPLEPSFSLELRKAGFKEFLQDASLLTTTWLLNGQVPVGGPIFVEADIPFSYFSQTQAGETTSEAAIGNPYLGMAYRTRTEIQGVDLRVGGRLPLSSDTFALFPGQLTSVEQFGSFLLDILTLRASGRYTYVFEEGGTLGATVAPFVTIPTGEDLGGNRSTDLFASYDVRGGYETEDIVALASLIGVVQLSDADLDGADRVVHQLGLALRGRLAQVEPGLHAYIPIQGGFFGVSDLVGFMFGFSVTFQFE